MRLTIARVRNITMGTAVLPDCAAVSGKTLRALVLEDDPSDFEILEHDLIYAGFVPQCRRVETKAEYLAHLTPDIDLILSDYSLPGWNALEALELYRASRLDIPFIVVSGTISEDVAVECMKRGAADYLLKDRMGRLGQAVAHAIENMAEKRLSESLAARLMMAQEEERRRISRELHDQVGQEIALLTMELTRLQAEVPPGDALHAGLATCRQLANDNAAIVRNIALLLRPSMLDDLGLVPALHWQAREVYRRTGLQVTVEAHDACNRLPDDYRTCIYRIVQEALHNVARHAKATEAHVTVRDEPLQIRVTIGDDGCGFDPHHQKGIGILGMEERVRYLGGAFQISSDPGRGTCLTIMLPRREAEPRYVWANAQGAVDSVDETTAAALIP
jgi:signal transduction histidine kinase